MRVVLLGARCPVVGAGTCETIDMADVTGVVAGFRRHLEGPDTLVVSHLGVQV